MLVDRRRRPRQPAAALSRRRRRRHAGRGRRRPRRPVQPAAAGAVRRRGSQGRPKAAAAAERLRRLNPHVERRSPHDAAARRRPTPRALVAGYDLVADGSDNLATRLAVHDACRDLRPTAGERRRSRGSTASSPPTRPISARRIPACAACSTTRLGGDALPSCAQGGVLGPVAGVLGTLQAVEVVKELAGHRPLPLRHAPALRCRGGAPRADPDRRRADCAGCAAVRPVTRTARQK